jgi:CheY-like chemotaxis protein
MTSPTRKYWSVAKHNWYCPPRSERPTSHYSHTPHVMNRKRTLLVVDDSPTAILWHRLLLEDEGYLVLTAADGAEGVDVARANLPELVLLDVIMPRMNGFEACRALRDDDRTRDIPVLMITTRSEMENVLQGFESGCNEYITKPVDRVELLTKVRSYLDRPEHLA